MGKNDPPDHRYATQVSPLAALDLAIQTSGRCSAERLVLLIASLSGSSMAQVARAIQLALIPEVTARHRAAARGGPFSLTARNRACYIS